MHHDIDETTEEELAPTPYGRKLGERLRLLRRQKGMSLLEVEAASSHTFKASVLGAYERGERSISVARLERLARCYSVPVDQMLPRDDASPDPGLAGSGYVPPIMVDLERLDEHDGPAGPMLRRFVHMLQVQRQDFNGRVLTVPSSDVTALAAMLDAPRDRITERLDELGLLFQR